MYSKEGVRQMCRGGVPRGADYLGSGNNSVEAQHRSAIDFWEKALTLDGPEQLNVSDAEYARSEIARHQAALADKPDFSVAARMRRARDNSEDLASIAQGLASGYGGGESGRLKEQRNFWQKALLAEDAPGKPTLTKPMRAFVEGEVARLEREIAKIDHPALNRYSAEPFRARGV